MTLTERAAQSTAIRVDDTDGEGNVRWDLHFYRAIRLDRGIAEDVAHSEASTRDTEGRVRHITRVLIGLRHDFFEAQEAGRAGRIRGIPGIADSRDAARHGYGAIDVVDTADVQDADAFSGKVLREVHARRAIQDRRRQRMARACDHFRIDEAFLGRDDGLLRVVAHVIDVHAVERRGFDRRSRGVVETIRRTWNDA